MKLEDEMCKGSHDIPKVSRGEALKYLKLIPGWKLSGNKITRDLEFKDFGQALEFVNEVGAIAESQTPPPEHPDTLFGMRFA